MTEQLQLRERVLFRGSGEFEIPRLYIMNGVLLSVINWTILAGTKINVIIMYIL